MVKAISNKITVIFFFLKTERLNIWYECDQVAFWEFIILLQDPLCVVFRSVSYSIANNRIYLCLPLGVCSNVLHQRDNQENISQYSRSSTHGVNIILKRTKWSNARQDSGNNILIKSRNRSNCRTFLPSKFISGRKQILCVFSIWHIEFSKEGFDTV